MGGRRPPPTTSLDGWDEPADVYVVITVRLKKATFIWFPLGTNFSVPEYSDFRREHVSRFEIRGGNRHRYGSLSAWKHYLSV